MAKAKYMSTKIQTLTHHQKSRHLAKWGAEEVEFYKDTIREKYPYWKFPYHYFIPARRLCNQGEIVKIYDAFAYYILNLEEPNILPKSVTGQSYWHIIREFIDKDIIGRFYRDKTNNAMFAERYGHAPFAEGSAKTKAPDKLNKAQDDKTPDALKVLEKSAKKV